MTEIRKTRKTRFRVASLHGLPRVFKAAGVVFTDGRLILAGYQPLKKKPFISGLGGSKEPGESYKDTALREMVEELFEFKTVPPELIAELKAKCQPSRILHSATYVRLVYTFEDLESILKIINSYTPRSPLYVTFPLTLMDLLFDRKVKGKAELSHLCLLPVVKHDPRDPFVVPYFVKEMCDYLVEACP